MKRPIGIFDSGVGGLTVYKAIRRTFPEEDLIYFGDTARVPYGPKSPNTIIDYSVQNARFLIQKGIKILVVACNTSSAVAIPALQQISDIPIIGVITPGAETAARTTVNNRVGVIGTEGTIRSQAYSAAIKHLLPDAEVYSQPCPLFVSLAEEGWQDHPSTAIIAQDYLSFFDDLNIDTLVLGCTHYPLLTTVIKQCIGNNVSLVDSAEAIAAYLHQLIPADSDGQPGKDTFFVSDSENRFARIAEMILGYRINRLKRVRMFESWFEEQ